MMQPLWKKVWGFLKKLKIVLSYTPSNPNPGHISRQNYSSKYAHTPMFTAALFTINLQDMEAICRLTDEWIKM